MKLELPRDFMVRSPVSAISWVKRMQRVQWMQRFWFWTTCGPIMRRS